MSKYNYHQTRFLKSEPNITYKNINSGIEVAFLGYSNSGKSSALNFLTNQKKLSRTSKVPGCTKLVNFFEVFKGFYLLDFPGYGYVKYSYLINSNFKNVVFRYLNTSTILQGIVVFMDIRHPMKKIDQEVIKLAFLNKIQVLILLTKSDKISFSLQKKVLIQIKHIIFQDYNNTITVELFSIFNKDSVKKLSNMLDLWSKN
ncbi:Probable GTP-binding protein EngB [Buchnera aphidicola (Neophyllaphis podocarpi)]|uniref:ribosome biogenesis GTP-binding protein YihA/YsxC n=1 Tax=Buchnera aphidicola TaxID=9 RepID=UPI0031B88605